MLRTSEGLERKSGRRWLIVALAIPLLAALMLLATPLFCPQGFDIAGTGWSFSSAIVSSGTPDYHAYSVYPQGIAYHILVVSPGRAQLRIWTLRIGDVIYFLEPSW